MNPSVEYQFINHVFNKLVEQNYFTHQRTVSGLKIRNRGDVAIFIQKNRAAKNNRFPLRLYMGGLILVNKWCIFW